MCGKNIMHSFGKWLMKIVKVIFDEMAQAGEILEIGRINNGQWYTHSRTK